MLKFFKVKDGDNEKNNNMVSFHIDNDNLLEENKTTWTRIEFRIEYVTSL